MVNYSVVLLLGVASKSVSLMAGSTTGIPMSPGYGGYQTATPPPYYTASTYAKSYYTTKASECYATTYAAPNYYTDAPKYYSAPSCYTTKAPEYDTTTYAAPSYYTEAAKYYCSQLLTTPMLLSTTLFPATTPRLQLITSPKRSNTTLKRQTTTLPRSTQPQPAKYFAAPTYYIEAVSSYYVEPNQTFSDSAGSGKLW